MVVELLLWFLWDGCSNQSSLDRLVPSLWNMVHVSLTKRVSLVFGWVWHEEDYIHRSRPGLSTHNEDGSSPSTITTTYKAKAEGPLWVCDRVKCDLFIEW